MLRGLLLAAVALGVAALTWHLLGSPQPAAPVPPPRQPRVLPSPKSPAKWSIN